MREGSWRLQIIIIIIAMPTATKHVKQIALALQSGENQRSINEDSQA